MNSTRKILVLPILLSVQVSDTLPGHAQSKLTLKYFIWLFLNPSFLLHQNHFFVRYYAIDYITLYDSDD